MSHVLVVIAPPEPTPSVYGPFDVPEAVIVAERLRSQWGLPVEATPTNNEIWTDAGWYFGVVPVKGVPT